MTSCVLIELMLFESFHHPADAIIHAADFRGDPADGRGVIDIFPIIILPRMGRFSGEGRQFLIGIVGRVPVLAFSEQ